MASRPAGDEPEEEGDAPEQARARDELRPRRVDADEVIMNLHLAYFRTAFDLGRATAMAARERETPTASPRCNCEMRRERNREAARASRKRARESKQEPEKEG